MRLPYKMKFKTLLLSCISLMLVYSCSVQKSVSDNTKPTPELSKHVQQQLDSILQRGLDHEALYTIVGNIKPISSVASFSYPIANTDSVNRIKGAVLDVAKKQQFLDKITRLNTLINTLDYPDLKFVLVPYQQAYKNERILQLSVVRVSKLDSVLKAKASFFGQFGLTPGADPAVVIATIEGSEPYERFRGYGYLFGYPDYAVDFYVEAFDIKQKTNEFVKRNFFQIPTYSSDTGAFVYAYPKNHSPTKIDSTLYFHATSVLSKYKEIRTNYLNQDKTLKSSEFLHDYFNKSIQN